MTLIPLRLGLQQRVLPEYRVSLFDTLADTCRDGLGVFAGEPQPIEAIDTSAKLIRAVRFHANNVHVFRGRGYFCLQPNIVQWLNEWQPDALIVEANTRYLSTPSAVEWMHRHRRPVIGWGLGAPESNLVESTLRSRFLKSLDAIVAYSRTGAEQYAAAGNDPERVFVAANAVTFRPKGPAPIRVPAFKGGQPCILFVGRLQERKRVEILLQACAALPPEIAPRLVIVGDGPDRARLEDIALKVYPNAEFTGAKHGGQLDVYYQTADIFVLPGTGGLAIQQAMAHGLPVIVGEADGTQGELVSTLNGWLLEQADAQALTRVLLDALYDVPRLRSMGLESFRIVAEEVNIEHMVEVFASAVEFAVSHPRGY